MVKKRIVSALVVLALMGLLGAFAHRARLQLRQRAIPSEVKEVLPTASQTV